MTPSERIKIIRKELGISMEEFGGKVGVTRQAIYKLENNTNKVSPQMAKLICREFKVEYEWLMTGEGEMFVSGDDELNAMIDSILFGENEFYIRLIKACASLSEDELDMVQNMINKLK